MFATASATVRKSSAHANEPSGLPPTSTTGITWRNSIPRLFGLSGQLSAFERMGRAALVVDDQARVLDLNACVRLGDGLQISGGMLQAARAVDRPRLQRFLSAITTQARDSHRAPATLALPRPSGRRPWLLDGVDCSDKSCSPPSRAAALLLITDVEQPSRLSADLLAQIFGLTSTEARLAIELASGKSLCDVSAHLAISEGHARQRLKTIFCKTSTSRQGELIALLAKLG
jgi:DNA-binding CsgD family transcriptional regulator